MLWNDYIIAAGIVVGASIIALAWLAGMIKIAEAIRYIKED